MEPWGFCAVYGWHMRDARLGPRRLLFTTIFAVLSLFAHSGCRPSETIEVHPPPSAPPAPSCGNATCSADQTCVSYFPVRNRPGPLIEACEQTCAPTSDGCPQGSVCTMESAGAGFVCRAEITPSPDPQVARLVQLANVWSFVRFAHPWLMDRSAQWRLALIDAVPHVREATDDDGLVAALDDMLGTLHDPATGFEGRSLPELSTSIPAIEERDGTLVVTLRALDNWLDPAIKANVAQSLSTADAIAFDVRGIPRSLAPYLAQLFETWNGQLVADDVQLPTTRHRVFNGYPTEVGFTSGGYNQVVESPPVVTVASLREGKAPRVAFVIGHDQVIPPIAIPLVERGEGVIVSTDTLDARTHGHAIVRELSTSHKYAVRTNDVLYNGQRPSLKASAVDPNDPLSTALKLLERRPRARVLEAFASAPPITHTTASNTPPGAAQRIANVIDLWSTLDRFHAYPDLRPRWANALPLALAQARDASTTLEYVAALRRLVASTGDAHSRLTGGLSHVQFGKGLPPFRPGFVEGCLVVMEIPDQDNAKGLHEGDVIVSIDGVDVTERFSEVSPFIAASTPASHRGASAWQMLKGADDEPLTLSIDDGKEIRTVAVSRVRKLSWPKPQIEPYRLDSTGTIGLVDLRLLEVAEVPAMFEALADTKAIIFDMRGYPRRTAWAISPYLNVNTQPTISATVDRPVLRAGERSSSSFSTLVPQRDVERYQGKTVMLIDERTVSQSEYTGMMFEAANGTTFVGSPSSGTNGDITKHQLLDEFVVTFTGQSFEFPDGRRLQRAGIQPNVFVRPTLAGFRAGRDEVMEAALATLIP